MCALYLLMSSGAHDHKLYGVSVSDAVRVKP